MVPQILIKKRALMFQLCRFAGVGITAALVNFIVVVWVVESFHWQPLLANVLAFIVAFQVSVTGHHYWTFNATASIKKTWLKFLPVGIMGLVLSEVLFYVLLHPLGLYYPLALLITLMIVPGVTFVLGKYWAFS